MPHVFKRTKDGCGERIDQAKAKEAGLTQAGFAPKQSTPYDEWPVAVASSRHEAERLLRRILEVYGLPGGTATEGSTPASPRAAQSPSGASPTGSPRATTPPAFTAPVGSEGDDDIFYYFLDKVKAAFETTDICAYQRQRGLDWWYSVCALPLRRGADLLLGLKWGADMARGHRPQTAPPSPKEVAEVQGYRFISRSRPYLERYVGPLAQFNYLNVCPFRSHKLEYLTARDWQIAIDHFFIEAIDYLAPPMTVVIGTTDVKMLTERGLVTAEPVRVRVNGKTETGYRGVIRGSQREYPFGAVPQPTYAMTNQARDALWAEVFK